MKQLSTLNTTILLVYFIPTLLLALLGYCAVPLLNLLGAFFPKTAIKLLLAISRWADRKTAEWNAAFERLAKNGSQPHGVVLCRRCGGQMKPSKAIAQTWTGQPEWPGDTIYTMSPGGPGKMIDCLKCVNCGHSISSHNI